jgi:hypothetical protein
LDFDSVDSSVYLNSGEKIIRVLSRRMSLHTRIPGEFHLELPGEDDSINDVIRPDVVPQVRLCESQEQLKSKMTKVILLK